MSWVALAWAGSLAALAVTIVLAAEAWTQFIRSQADDPMGDWPEDDDEQAAA